MRKFKSGFAMIMYSLYFPAYSSPSILYGKQYPVSYYIQHMFGGGGHVLGVCCLLPAGYPWCGHQSAIPDGREPLASLLGWELGQSTVS